jgi:hypothetical protein
MRCSEISRELDPEINPVIIEHNALATKVMKEEGVPIDDLNGLMMPFKLALHGLMKTLPVDGSSTCAPRGMPRTSIRL